MDVRLLLGGKLEELVKKRAEDLGVGAAEAVRTILADALNWQNAAGAPSHEMRDPGGSAILRQEIASGVPRETSDGVEPSRTRADKIPSLQKEEEKRETNTNTFVLGSPAEFAPAPDDAFLPGLAPEAVAPPQPRWPSAREVELAWRVQECWAAHADKRRRFFAEVEGIAARPRSSPPPDIAAEIRAAILAYDGEFLGAEQRDEWRRESWARAAGLGIFLDPWCTAEHPENKMGEPGAKRYLEPWRPWHVQRGKGSPVSRFADLYYQRRALDEGARPPAAAERPPLAIVRAAGG